VAVMYNAEQWPECELVGRRCFYCGRPVQPPGVYWHGFGDEDVPWIVLHPGCVIDLFVRLARDVHEIECRTRYCVTVESWRHRRTPEEFR